MASPPYRCPCRWPQPLLVLSPCEVFFSCTRLSLFTNIRPAVSGSFSALLFARFWYQAVRARPIDRSLPNNLGFITCCVCYLLSLRETWNKIQFHTDANQSGSALSPVDAWRPARIIRRVERERERESKSNSTKPANFFLPSH